MVMMVTGALWLALVPGAFDAAAEDTPITAPWFEPRVTAGPRPIADLFHEPGLLYINFEGADMQSCGGSDWPVMNCSTIMNDTVLPYSGDGAARAAVVQIMASDVSAYAIEVTDVRPADDAEYDMLMVGNWSPPPEDGNFAGVAPTIDCWNNSRGETAFSLDYSSASVVAKIVGQEAAHLWGLEHVDSQDDLLFPTVGGAADPSFEDICRQIVVLDGGIQPTTAQCGEMHAINCPDQPDHQNSSQDLMMLFGPPEPDMVAPQLSILAPAEGQEFESGATVELTIEMFDNIAPPLFAVFANIDVDDKGDQVGSSDYLGPQLTVPIEGLADGEHTIRVDIADQDGNESNASVSFVVGQAVMGGTDGGGTSEGPTSDGGGSSSSDGSESTTGDGGSSGGSSDASADEAGGDDGCGCRSHRPGALPSWLWLSVFLVRRRRGSRTSPC